MLKRFFIFYSLLFYTSSLAEESPESIEETNLPSVADCIPKAVSDLPKPTNFTFDQSLAAEISTENEEAQIHTMQGLCHLHGGWQFEASRHFAVAIHADPECLTAHWGMIMSMLAPSPETNPHRLACTKRLIHIIANNHGNELERSFADGLVKLIKEGSTSAAPAFRKIADKYPDDIQAGIYAALFDRSGYTEMGDITPSQAAAEERLSTLIQRFPDNPVAIHALLAVRAEAPDLRPSLELARKLCKQVPAYPPYFHLLGHYEWRCGNHDRAIAAFARSTNLYSSWMKKNQVTPADCPQWIRAQCYHIVAIASSGDFENAIPSAIRIASTTLDPNRPYALGTRMILWEAKTLPARILMSRGAHGDPAKALASLPNPEEMEIFRKHSLSHWWINGLRIVLEAQSLLEANKLEKATDVSNAVTFHGEAMEKHRAAAASIGENAEWRRSFFALEVLAAELRGRLALAGPKEGHGSAFNWFRAAIDRQGPATMLNPPPILTPMATRLGDYYLAINEPSKALQSYKEALAAFPNDQQTLERSQKAQALTSENLKNEE